MMNKVVRIVLFLITAIIISLVTWFFPHLHASSLWIIVDSMVFSVIPFLRESLKSLKQKAWFRGVPIYFLVQYLGRFLILCGVVLNTIPMVKSWVGRCLICVGCGLKLGLFPFHFWVKLRFIDFHYLGVFIAGTGQKIFIVYAVPFFTNDLICTTAFYLIAVMTIVWGSVGILRSIEVKPFLGYLSINYTGFLSLCADYDFTIACQYATGYSLTIFFLRLILLQRNCQYLRDLGSKIPLYYKAGFFFLASRISGFPPFMEFSVKYAVIIILWGMGLHFTVYVIIISSLIVVVTWLSLFPFITLNILKSLEFGGRASQNVLNIFCIIWRLFSGFGFGIL